MSACRAAETLAHLFLTIFTVQLVNVIARESQKYANEEFVKLVDAGHRKKRKIFENCQPNDEGARHRAEGPAHKKWNITPGYIIAWLGILIYHSARKTDRSISLYWRARPYGWRDSCIVNTMTRDGFHFLRRFIHFAASDKRRQSKDPLYKIRIVIELLQTQFPKLWNAGEHICVDESMIKYKGRSITFIQFMPTKPIKHGIKVFALCCSVTGYLLAFEVYTGRTDEEQSDTKLKSLIDRLLVQAGLNSGSVGCILYSDNYYTSLKTSCYLYETYGMLSVGTLRLSEKVSRGCDDIPFHKLSKAALAHVDRGWSRRATRRFKSNHGRQEYVVQCTVWKDKKQVGFLHTTCVGQNDGSTTLRHEKGKRSWIEITCPPVQKDYIQHFNGVDHNDRDSAEYPSSIKTNRWYLRIFFWLLDRIVLACYVLVVWYSKAGLRPEWECYVQGQSGHYDFQIDLGLSLIEYGI